MPTQFDPTPNGTRGSRIATTRFAIGFMNLLNRMVAGRVRKTGRIGPRANALVLTTIGRKSGVPRTSVVGWFPPDAGEGWLICASAGGGARNPNWYYNLAANPDRVTVETAGVRTDVLAKQLEGPEREAAWHKITSMSAQFAHYGEMTDRQIAVIRLTPTTSRTYPRG